MKKKSIKKLHDTNWKNFPKNTVPSVTFSDTRLKKPVLKTEVYPFFKLPDDYFSRPIQWSVSGWCWRHSAAASGPT